MEKEKQSDKEKLEKRKKELLDQLDNTPPRKLSTLEKNIIAEATEQLFAVHYMDVGYNFIENDINIFYYFVNKNKEAHRNKLPVAQDLDYCYKVVQEIIYIARLLRYEQRMLSNNILRCNVKLKDLYFKVKDANKENNKKLEEDLLRTIGLFADVQAMTQYLIMLFEILNIDKTKYKDVINKTPKKDYEKFLNYTLSEFLKDNYFLKDIYDKLEEVQEFLIKDNNKAYSEIVKMLKNNDTDTTIKQVMQSLKNLSKELLKEANEMQKELQIHNKKIDVELFKSHLLYKSDTDLLSVSLEYLNSIADFYKDQIILRGFNNEQKTPKK